MFRVSFVLFFVFWGCQSRPTASQAFVHLKPGMLKGDVLETMGSPARSSRKSGIDRWYYYMEPQNPKSIKVLHFENSRLVYKGPPMKPLLTADEMDEINRQYKHQGQGKKLKPYKRRISDKQLKTIIKKEMKNESPKDSRFEEI